MICEFDPFEQLKKNGCVCHRIALNKSGIKYNAFAVQQPKSEDSSEKTNNAWVLIAGGNMEVGLGTIGRRAEYFHKKGFNVFYVDGPRVGGSKGQPTSYSIGAGQEAGLQFLETVVKAKKILLYGDSLGGGAHAKAIEIHDFKNGIDKGIQYMVVSSRTFDKLSHMAATVVGSFVKPIWLS